jgi:tRNA pseudouridine55 synthase
VARDTGGNAASGLIVVDKPGGLTSHDVVARIRRLAGTRRVGHAGTLDPMATGVLVVGVEKATRLLGHLTLTDKEYQATIRLGQVTDTGDAEGTITSARPAGHLTLAQVQAAAAALTGEIQQVPPAVSAIKVKGRRAYQLAREGTPPVLEPRPVTVWSFTVRAVRPAQAGPPGAAPDGSPGSAPDGSPGSAPDGSPGPAPDGWAGDLLDVDVEVRCSSGTYIRALARDMGDALGVGGHLTSLRRTRVGPYGLSVAHTLDELAGELTVLPLAEAAAEAFPVRHLTAEQASSLSHGGRLPGLAETAGPSETGGPVAAFAPDGTLIALIQEKDGVARPLAVFVP